MPGTITYPIDKLTWDNGTTIGDLTGNAVRGPKTVLLGTAPGLDDLGRQRLREPLGATTISVGRSSQGRNDGELDVVDNAHITVLDDHRIWAKIPYISPGGLIYKDSDILPEGNVLTPPPVANAGPGTAGDVDATGYFSVQFSGANSFYFLNDGHVFNVSSFQWEPRDGIVIAGSLTSSSVTLKFPPGFRWVGLRCQSPAGKIHYTYVPVYARNPLLDRDIEHQIVSHSMTLSGQELQIKILESLWKQDYPDGTLVMMWNRNPYNSADRTHMQFIGWMQSDQNTVTAGQTGNLKDTIIRCVDVLGRLKALPGFPQILTHSKVNVPGGDTVWTFTPHNTILYYVYYLLMWHSSALEVCDLLKIDTSFDILTFFRFKILGSDEGSLYDQVEKICASVTPDHHFTCTRRGQMALSLDPMICRADSRPPTVMATFTEDEWISIAFDRQQFSRTYQLISYAVLGTSESVENIIPIACIAPGLAQGQGLDLVETSERIAASQGEFNLTEGNRYARLNAPYGNFTIVMPYFLLGDEVDPATQYWVILNWSDKTNLIRPLPSTGARGIITQMSFAFEYSKTGITCTVTLTWEYEISGPPALTYDPNNPFG